ncbi:hypothetical protein MKS88_005234 [Plasmodium brasilianum]|uniref:Uncharacterized protein n=1 Tax=Plasmodium brasilianum TaxID=5824 RepID=A0ACB9Y200_PLABR|nr:hypothetical protein MKS88_005234 [Plasmodium brasilianum]
MKKLLQGRKDLYDCTVQLFFNFYEGIFTEVSSNRKYDEIRSDNKTEIILMLNKEEKYMHDHLKNYPYIIKCSAENSKNNNCKVNFKCFKYINNLYKNYM